MHLVGTLLLLAVTCAAKERENVRLNIDYLWLRSRRWSTIFGRPTSKYV